MTTRVGTCPTCGGEAVNHDSYWSTSWDRVPSQDPIRHQNALLRLALRRIYLGAAEEHDGFTYGEIARIADEALQTPALSNSSVDTRLAEVRQAIADYMRSEGCSCCRDKDAHEKRAARLAKLLDVPMYEDGSGYDFGQFSSDRTAASSTPTQGAR